MTPSTPRIPTWLPRLLAVAVIAGSIGGIGWQAWHLRQDFRLPALPTLQAPAAPAAPGSLGNLFATRQVSVPSGGASIAGLQLQASLVADVASQSRALILVPGSGTLNLQVGDWLHDDLVVESVSADHVTLRQGASLHLLMLDTPGLDNATADTALP